MCEAELDSCLGKRGGGGSIHAGNFGPVNRHQDSLVNMPPHLLLSSCEIRGKDNQLNFEFRVLEK